MWEIGFHGGQIRNWKKQSDTVDVEVSSSGVSFFHFFFFSVVVGQQIPCVSVFSWKNIKKNRTKKNISKTPEYQYHGEKGWRKRKRKI